MIIKKYFYKALKETQERVKDLPDNIYDLVELIIEKNNERLSIEKYLLDDDFNENEEYLELLGDIEYLEAFLKQAAKAKKWQWKLNADF